MSLKPFDRNDLSGSGANGFVGPVVKLGRSLGDTSGRIDVAGVIAGVFPAHMALVR